MNTTIKNENSFLPQARYLYRHTISCAFLTAALMIVVSIVIWGSANTNLILAWLGLGFINFIGRFFFHLYIERNFKTVESEILSKFFILLSSAYTGLIWCCCAIFFISDEQPEMIIFLVASIFGVISTMLPVLSAYLPSFYIFAMPIFLSLIYQFHVIGMISPAISMALCIVTSISISIHCHRSINQNLDMAKRSEKKASQQIKKRHIAEKMSKKAIKDNINKSKFMGSASHDLQQPLHAMNLCLEALSINLSKPKESEKIIEQLRLCHSNFTELFSSTIEFSNFYYDKNTIKPSTFKINEIVSPLIQEFEMESSIKGITFDNQVKDFSVLTDGALIKRLIRNLLSNAIKYSDSGVIKIKTKKIDNVIKVTVNDDGIGISKKHLSSIFDYAKQLDNPDNDHKKGVGLGLAIVKKIDERLNLKLSVKSKKGVGTQFTFYLPLASKQKHPKLVALDPKTGPLTLPKTVKKPLSTVLIIENDPDTREQLNNMAIQSHCRPLNVQSIQEARTLITENAVSPDLILSNYDLNQDHSGLDAIRKIRSVIGKPTPAIVTTADTCSTLAKRVRSTDTMIMYPPFTVGVFKNALRVCALS